MIRIPIDKARALSVQMKSTVHAGTKTETLLNNLIEISDGYEHSNSIAILDSACAEAANIHDLFYFFDEVGMLDG